MVKFRTKVDKNGRIYIAKPLREARAQCASGFMVGGEYATLLVTR